MRTLTDKMNPTKAAPFLKAGDIKLVAIFLIDTLTLQRRSRALAMHSNCLSPTEKFSPFSITSESSFIGSWATCVGKKRQKTLIAAQTFCISIAWDKQLLLLLMRFCPCSKISITLCYLTHTVERSSNKQLLLEQQYNIRPAWFS